MTTKNDDILRAQTERYHRLSRAYENFKKVCTTKLTRGLTEARLNALEQNWHKFDAHLEEALALRDTHSSNEFFKLDVPTLAEESYLEQKGVFLDIIRQFKAKEAALAVDTESQAPRTTLPRIQLPTFTGKYED